VIYRDDLTFSQLHFQIKLVNCFLNTGMLKFLISFTYVGKLFHKRLPEGHNTHQAGNLKKEKERKLNYRTLYQCNQIKETKRLTTMLL